MLEMVSFFTLFRKRCGNLMLLIRNLPTYKNVKLQKGRPSCSCCLKVDIVDSLTKNINLDFVDTPLSPA
jgi:hypothetical protein